MLVVGSHGLKTVIIVRPGLPPAYEKSCVHFLADEAIDYHPLHAFDEPVSASLSFSRQFSEVDEKYFPTELQEDLSHALQVQRSHIQCFVNGFYIAIQPGELNYKNACQSVISCTGRF